MSRKKHRNIVVNGVDYAWSVMIVDSYYKYNIIRIWKDKKIITDIHNRNEYKITPGKIERFIKLFLIKNPRTKQDGNYMLSDDNFTAEGKRIYH